MHSQPEHTRSEMSTFANSDFFFLSLCDTGLEALREQIEFEFTFVKLSTWIFRPGAVYVTVIAYIQIKRLQLADQTPCSAL